MLPATNSGAILSDQRAGQAGILAAMHKLDDGSSFLSG